MSDGRAESHGPFLRASFLELDVRARSGLRKDRTPVMGHGSSWELARDGMGPFDHLITAVGHVGAWGPFPKSGMRGAPQGRTRPISSPLLLHNSTWS